MAQQAMAPDLSDKAGLVESKASPGTARGRGWLQRVAESRSIRSLAVLSLLALVYLAVSFRWLEQVTENGVLRTYLGQPLLWGIIIMGVIFLSRKGPVRLNYSLRLAPIAGLVGFFHLAVMVLAGIIVGFGFSPYSHDILAMAVNVAYFVSSLVAFELARSFFLATWRPKNVIPAVVIIGLLFTILSTPLSQITNLHSPEATVSFLGGRALPEFGEQLLATYIALLGGPIPVLLYRGILQTFEWLSPVLPNLTWGLSGLLGLLVPYFGFLALRSVAYPESQGSDGSGTQAKHRKSHSSWLVLSFLSVAIIWFSLGLFPYKALVVGGASMEPKLSLGDLVILHSVDALDVEKGDIIQFRVGEASIIHRVIQVTNSTSAGRILITQGDNNAIADPAPVTASQVAGKVIFGVPKIGWLGILATRLVERAGALF